MRWHLSDDAATPPCPRPAFHAPTKGPGNIPGQTLDARRYENAGGDVIPRTSGRPRPHAPTLAVQWIIHEEGHNPGPRPPLRIPCYEPHRERPSHDAGDRPRRA
ncbi:hypothetical protein FKP32DRAFT_225776 [Trametes sanguinea]|nr:hypothetical protein FKP32DRAFT_225776 [Trametes sanguinea]